MLSLCTCDRGIDRTPEGPSACNRCNGAGRLGAPGGQIVNLYAHLGSLKLALEEADLFQSPTERHGAMSRLADLMEAIGLLCGSEARRVLREGAVAARRELGDFAGADRAAARMATPSARLSIEVM